MYLKNIFIENMGAIEKFSLEEKDLIKDDGTPRVVILVGQNGSGKTTFLSNIVDSFYQLAQGSFDDVLPKSGMGYKYFKVSGASNQRVNTSYGFSYLQFEKDSKKYEYIDKNGKLSFDECKKKTNAILSLNNNWKDEGNHKKNTSTTKGDAFSKDFESNSYCYFPSDRFEYPYWINEETVQKQEQFNDYSSFSGKLDKNIIVRQSLTEIKHWILDVFLDSMVTIESIIRQSKETKKNDDLLLKSNLSKGIENIELIISDIIEVNISFEINYRFINSSRLLLVNKKTREIILPSLNNLSAGQTTLLSIFLNIIRFRDKDFFSSLVLKDIEGIVVIDEVDLHLHIGLQKDILPQLIKRFPKVQFILTTHSPFFLNGMAKNFDKNDYIVVNMPSGNILDTYDEFEEFDRAYEIFDDLTNEKREEIKKLEEKVSKFTKPSIITEGKTDWKHFKRALEYFKDNGEFKDLDIEFMEYEDDFKMSESQLERLITELSKVSRANKVIGIFDCDTPIGKKYENEQKQRLSSHVYGLAIPTPDFRTYHSGICTEFLYKDENLKKVNKDGRRIYLSEEFSEKGRLKEDKKIGLENATKIKGKISREKSIIIDSGILDIDENSLALSKDAFSKNILNKDEPFDTMDFEGFRALFENIERIIKEEVS